MVVITSPSFSSYCPNICDLLAATFVCTVFSSYFASSRSQYFGSPCLRRWLCSSLAWCWLCSSACCWLCSSRFFSSFLSCSTISAALRAHRRFQLLFRRLFGFSFSLFFSLSWYHFILLFTTCSLALVHFPILSPLAVALSLILSRDTLW